MKLKIFTCLVTCTSIAVIGNAAAVSVNPNLNTCMTSTQCRRFTTKPYCCPNGNTGTTDVCPDDWILNISTGLCYRISDDAGEDDKGYMEIQYGTCEPTEDEYQCYVGSDDAQVTIDGYTARCVTGAPSAV